MLAVTYKVRPKKQLLSKYNSSLMETVCASCGVQSEAEETVSVEIQQLHNEISFDRLQICY